MMEFLMTMAVIALVFVAATALVVLIAGGLLRLKRGIGHSAKGASVK